MGLDREDVRGGVEGARFLGAMSSATLDVSVTISSDIDSFYRGRSSCCTWTDEFGERPSRKTME